MRWVKENIRVSPAFNGFLTFYLYPVLGTLIGPPRSDDTNKPITAPSMMALVPDRPLRKSVSPWLSHTTGLPTTNNIKEAKNKKEKSPGKNKGKKEEIMEQQKTRN